MGNKPKTPRRYIRTYKIIGEAGNDITIQACDGESITFDKRLLRKQEEWYYIASRYSRRSTSGFMRFVNATIDKNGNVHPRRESQKLVEDTERWDIAVKYNAKAKLIKAGTVDIINDKIMYIPQRGSVDARIPAIVQGIHSAHRTCPMYEVHETVKTITILPKWTTIPKGFAYGLYSLEKVVMPDTIHTFDGNAFSSCGLIEFECPENLSKISNNCFARCEGLKRVTFKGKTLKYIGELAFYGCYSLESVHLPNGIPTIPRGCFYGCRNLKFVHIPKSVNSIYDDAFSMCSPDLVIEAPAKLAGKIHTNARIVYYN